MSKSVTNGDIIIRVYGILLNNKNEVLLSDEFRMGMFMTKFPGGGLIFGEGPEECLKREAIEELEQPVEIIEHLYTTGFYQKAMFFENSQLISIYYKIDLLSPPAFKISSKPMDFEPVLEGSQSFRWAAIGEIINELTFPIDKKVGQMLLTKLKNGEL